MTDNPDFEAAATALLAARRNDMDLAPYRVLKVECEHNRKLLTVFRLAGHLIASTHPIQERASEYPTPWPQPTDTAPSLWQPGQRPLLDSGEALFELNENFADEMEYHVANQCCTRTVTLGWLRSQGFSAGRKAVLPGSGVE